VEDQEFTFASMSADWRRIEGGEVGMGERQGCRGRRAPIDFGAPRLRRSVPAAGGLPRSSSEDDSEIGEKAGWERQLGAPA
jgi:hypothetical protein